MTSADEKREKMYSRVYSSDKYFNDLKKYIRDIPDFPKPGVMFRDITPLLADSRSYRQVIDRMIDYIGGANAIAAIESRGFLFASPIAVRLGLPLILLRKPGKLPYKTAKVSYSLEYGENALEMHIDAVKKGDKVVVIDDVLATGGSATAAIDLIRSVGADVSMCIFLMELTELKGREKLDVPVHSLIEY